MSEGTAAIRTPMTIGVPSGRLGMWLFLASEVMFFAGLIGGYIVLRLGSASWPDPTNVLAVPVLGFNTFVLICSSVTMVRAVQTTAAGEPAKAKRFLLLTILAGLLFLGVKAFDYSHLIHEGFTPRSSLFGGCYFLLTGFHGAHVLGGVVTLSVLLGMGIRGRLGPERTELVECVGLYWHFVDLVWIILFAILCLV